MAKTISTTVSATTRGDWDFGSYGKYGISLTGSRTWSITDTNSQGTSTTETHQFSIPLKVQPGNVGVGATWVFILSMQATFTGTVVFDGPLVPNLEGYAMASQLLTESERTIQIEGTLDVTSASQAYNGIWEDSATADQCQNKAGTSTEFREYTGAVGTKTTGFDVYRGVTPPQFKQMGFAPNGRLLNWREAMVHKSKTHVAQIQAHRREGTPGDYCYIGACNRPLDGYRPVCRYDDEGECSVCYDEAEAICDPELLKKKP